MPPLLLGTLLLLGLVLLAAALGHRLLLWLDLPVSDLPERGVLAVALGLGFLQFLPFLLLAAGIGRPPSIRIGVGLLSLLLLPDMRAVLRSGVCWLRRARFPTGWQRLFYLAAGVVLLLLYVRALCPEVSGDPVAYHLAAPERYLTVGHFAYLPTYTYTNWPMGVQLLFALLLGLHPAAPAAIVQFLFGLVTLCGLYLLASRVAGREVGVMALGLMALVDNFAPHGFCVQMTHAFIDLGLTAFSTLAFFTLYRATTQTTEETQAAWLRLSALFAGLAATAKLTGLWVIVTGCLLALVHCRPPSGRFAWRQALLYGGIGAGVVLPWFLKTWALTGNPFYPMLTSVFGGIEWTPQGWERFQRAHFIWNTPAGMPPTPAVLLRTHLQITLAGCALALCLWVASRRSALVVLIRAWAVFAACICFANYLHPRFLMPAIPTFVLCLAYGLRRGQRGLPVVIACLALIAALLGLRRQSPPLSEAFSVARGQTSRDAYLRRHVEEYAATVYANTHLPVTARILLGGYDYKPALFRAEALCPEFGLQDSIHYDTPERLDSDLQRLGVGYLLLNPIYPDWCMGSHSCRERQETEQGALIALAQRHGTSLIQTGHYTLYRLNF